MSMVVQVALSKGSQELIASYLDLGQPFIDGLDASSLSISFEDLIAWLAAPHALPSKTKEEFILASLRASLLTDLLQARGVTAPPKSKADKKSWLRNCKFILLALAGTLLAACEGFDSIITMLGVLTVPSLVIFFCGISFAILSVVVFCGFGLVQVAKNLNLTPGGSRQLLDVYVSQLDRIKGLRKKINNEPNSEALQQDLDTLAMLETQILSLIEVSTRLTEALESKKMKAIRMFVSCLAGLLFFGSGFFAGQSVALFFSALLVPAVLPTFWPVILVSVLVGLAAFSIYWYLEREGLKKWVNGWFGLDVDKIEALCDNEGLEKEHQKITLLQDRLRDSLQLTERLDQAQTALENFKAQEAPDIVKESSNRYRFLAPAKTQESLQEPALTRMALI